MLEQIDFNICCNVNVHCKWFKKNMYKEYLLNENV